ncbi:hypothetical protein FRC12_016307 [Ceratobasidium sp. 428]|nr:hypothetical protein FRC12_016307 [Ceratobasidium sp. 428]
MIHIVVIGAGVIGLTTAIRVLELGYKVTILAEHLPGDKKSIEYASPWATAHHVSLAGEDVRQQEMDRETFQIMWNMSEDDNPAAKCFKRIQQFEHFIGTRDLYKGIEFMPNFRALKFEELAPSSDSGCTFTTVAIDPGVYLPYLVSVFLSKGGSITRTRIIHVSQVAQGSYTSSRPDAIIVCAGLGARFLGGVEDKDVYPIRGQTTLLRAPWIKVGCTQSNKNQTWTYAIPRPGGDVMIGGTRGVNDWYPHPRPETTDEIIARVLLIAPEIAPPQSRLHGREPTVDDVKSIVVEIGCGLRPGRKDGIRLEIGSVEWEGGKTPIIFNYGHAGYGYQSSWGSASIAVNLLKKALSNVS